MNMLGKVTSGRVGKPPLVLIYGPDGVGKTSFASGAPAPLFLGAEAGTDHLDVTRLGVDTLAEIEGALAELTAGGHNYKTLVVDTLDWMETMVYAHVIRAYGKADYTSVEDFSYGKGRVHALETWRGLIKKLDAVRATGMGVVLLAHSFVKKFEDPSTPQGYERYQLKLQSGAGSDVAGLMREYVDFVGFLNYETVTSSDDKRRGFGDGSRLLHVSRSPALDAKNRYGLTAPIRLPDDPGNTGKAWAHFSATLGGASASPAAIEAEVEALISQVNDVNVREKAKTKFDTVKGNQAELGKLKNSLLAYVSRGKETK